MNQLNTSCTNFIALTRLLDCKRKYYNSVKDCLRRVMLILRPYFFNTSREFARNLNQVVQIVVFLKTCLLDLRIVCHLFKIDHQGLFALILRDEEIAFLTKFSSL